MESGARNNAFKSSVLAPWGQAGVWPEKLPAGGAWYGRLGSWECMDKTLIELRIVHGAESDGRGTNQQVWVCL